MASNEEQAEERELTEEQAKQAEDQHVRSGTEEVPPSQFQAQGSTNVPSAPWLFDLSGMTWISQFPPLVGGRPDQAGSSLPMVPVLCSVPFPGCFQGQREEQRLRSGGIFAVPMVPVIGPVAGYPPSGLIPVSYNIPQNTPGPGNSASVAGSHAFESAIPAQQQEVAADAPLQGLGPLPPLVAAQVAQAQRPEGQRQIVRRFHVAFQIDLLLILKLAVAVFIFNQDGSKDRLFLLLFLAGLVYLYQTGALSPVLRWISQSAQRAMMPPQQAQPVRAAPADAQLRAHVEGENAAPHGPAPGAAAAADNRVVAPDAEGGGGGGAAAEDEQVQPQAPVQGAAWWGFLKEVQMLVVGFVTSLLPGFHHHMD